MARKLNRVKFSKAQQAIVDKLVQAAENEGLLRLIAYMEESTNKHADEIDRLLDLLEGYRELRQSHFAPQPKKHRAQKMKEKRQP